MEMCIRDSIQRDAQYIAQNSFTGIQSVLCLLEIVCLGIVDHIIGYFGDTGQRMQDTQVGTGMFQHLVAQDVDIIQDVYKRQLYDTLYGKGIHALQRDRGAQGDRRQAQDVDYTVLEMCIRDRLMLPRIRRIVYL